MTQQDQIALLAEALQEVGKMPEFFVQTEEPTVYKLRKDAFWHETRAVFPPDDLVLAALAGIAAEFIADAGYYIVKSGSSYSDCDEDGNEMWEQWVWEVVSHDWQCGNTPISQHALYHAALAAAVRVAGKGEKQ